MNELLVLIIKVILLLVSTVLIHELGHFIALKYFNQKIEKVKLKPILFGFIFEIGNQKMLLNLKTFQIVVICLSGFYFGLVWLLFIQFILFNIPWWIYIFIIIVYVKGSASDISIANDFKSYVVGEDRNKTTFQIYEKQLSEFRKIVKRKRSILVKMSQSKKDNHCVSCGKLCWGKRCWDCFKKGRHSTVSEARAHRRYREEKKKRR